MVFDLAKNGNSVLFRKRSILNTAICGRDKVSSKLLLSMWKCLGLGCQRHLEIPKPCLWGTLKQITQVSEVASILDIDERNQRESAWHSWCPDCGTKVPQQQRNVEKTAGSEYFKKFQLLLQLPTPQWLLSSAFARFHMRLGGAPSAACPVLPLSLRSTFLGSQHQAKDDSGAVELTRLAAYWCCAAYTLTFVACKALYSANALQLIR